MNIALIFAGGSGVRMGAGVPKQFLEINGKPILIHTLQLFEDHHLIDKIYLSVLEEYIPYVRSLVEDFNIKKVDDIIAGGATAQDSIYNGLMRAGQSNPKDSVVLIHDGVRPFISYEVITKNISSVKKHGSAITSTLCYETVLKSKDGKAVDDVLVRKETYTAQAPQSFRLGDIIEAHDIIRSRPEGYENMVDSCTIMKKIGKDAHLIEGNRGNIKVTTPEDVYFFRALIQYKENEQAFGFGLTDKMRSKMNKYKQKYEDELEGE